MEIQTCQHLILEVLHPFAVDIVGTKLSEDKEIFTPLQYLCSWDVGHLQLFMQH